MLIQPKIDGDKLTISAPGMTDFTLNIAQIDVEQKATKTKLYYQHVETIDCGDGVAKWLSRFIVAADVGLRLVYYPKNVPSREVPPENRIYAALTNDDMVRYFFNFFFAIADRVYLFLYRVHYTKKPVLCY